MRVASAWLAAAALAALCGAPVHARAAEWKPETGEARASVEPQLIPPPSNVSRMHSPSQLQSLLQTLPLGLVENDDGPAERGLDFGLKPGKKPRAVVRFRF